MIHLTDEIRIGDAMSLRDVAVENIGAVLNVACDLRPGQELRPRVDIWPEVEYAQVGLMDGPGNEVTKYCAAVLVLCRMVNQHKPVLVYDHSGGRALAICLMHLCLTLGRRPAGGAGADRNNAHCWRPWSELHSALETTAAPKRLPRVHESHIAAYNGLPYGLLEAITRC